MATLQRQISLSSHMQTDAIINWAEGILLTTKIETTINSAVVEVANLKYIFSFAGHSRSSTVPSIMNPFQCEVEFDDLTADDSIIDYCYVRDDNFMLVILLASNGTYISDF